MQMRTASHDVVVINGPSSAGKTSIARALQEALGVVYLNFSIDSVLYGLPPSDLARMMRGEPITRDGYDYGKLVLGFNAAAASLLATGNRLILDNGLARPDLRLDLREKLAPYRHLWVGVTCDLDVLLERERARGDRAPGLAERQARLVHQDLSYDLIVDSSTASPEELAGTIVARMAEV